MEVRMNAIEKRNIGIVGACSILAMASVKSVAGERVAEAGFHEKGTKPSIKPGRAPRRPRVLIIGDSISMGYTEPVRTNLKGIADVFRPPVNCQHTGYGLANIANWLGTSQWDVIHFNFGIWDTHLLDSKGDLLSGSRSGDNKSPSGEIRIRHTPEQYQENLTKLVEILKGTGAELVWASTTPIMYRTGNRFEAIPTLNRIAADLMKVHGIPVDDLYAFVLPHGREWQLPDQCHFNARGNDRLGKKVSECIRHVLNSRNE
jgi:hypothetical protein